MDKQLELKRISSEEIARALEKLAIYKGCNLSECINSTDRAVAQAQLQDDQQVLDNVKQAIFEDFKEAISSGELNTIISRRFIDLEEKWLK